MIKAKIDALVPCSDDQLDIGPGAYKRAFLTHRNAVTTAVKRVAGAPCVTEDERKEVLRADLERNVSLCLHNSF